MAAFEAQFNILSEAIKTRAPLKKVETDANALAEFFEKALKIAIIRLKLLPKRQHFAKFGHSEREKD